VDLDLNLLFVVLMFASFLALLLSGYPVAWVLAGVGVWFAAAGALLNAAGLDVDADLSTLGLVVDRIYGTMSNYGLVALPLFIFMGHMLDRSGVAAELLRAMQTLLERVAGGLALAVTVLGVVLAASTGIIGASVALLGTLALPAMLDDGYQPELAVGTVAAAGCLGILIPPSIMLVLMSEPMQLSVGDLFLGAVFPGLLLAGLYLGYLGVVCTLRPELAPARRHRNDPEVARAGLDVMRALLPPVLLIMAVLGSIFFGVVSPSEAAGIGALGASVLALAKRRLDTPTLREVSRATARTTSFIFAIFLGATCFSVVLRELGGDQVIEAGITALPFGATGVVVCLMALVFALGFFLDWIEITLIVLPLVEPITSTLGIDKLWFTVLVAVCLQTSFLTPPVGFALFYLKGVAPPQIDLGHLYRGIVPFVVLQLIGLAAIFFWPGLVTWLPSVAFD
jgi:tripartite ATP-independent transporter DctM subunit